MDPRRGRPADPRLRAQPDRGNVPLTVALGFALISVVLWLAVFVRGLAGVRRTVVVRPAAEERPASLVAFMPARDEVDVIDASVAAVLAQGPVERLVVIDDGSTDGTTAKLDALADPKLTVLSGAGPGPGEYGKPAALAGAYERIGPSGEWLLFVDADVRLEAGAVSALLALADRADLVTLIPTVGMRTAVEHVVMPSVGSMVLAANPPHAVADPKRPEVFANGQVLLVRRSVYEGAGGHRAVVGEVLEDVRLAKRIKERGGRILVVDGRLLAETRMYASWSELREGWTKNLYLLLGGSRIATIRWVALAMVLGWIGPAAAAAAGWPYGVAAYGAILLMQVVLRLVGGAPPQWAILAPIGATVASFLAIDSMRRHARGRITWKGRTY